MINRVFLLLGLFVLFGSIRASKSKKILFGFGDCPDCSCSCPPQACPSCNCPSTNEIVSSLKEELENNRRSISSDVKDSVADVEMNIQKNGESIQKNGESIQKNGESIQKNGESIQKNGESIQKNGESIQKNGESIQKNGESIKKNGESIRQNGESIKKNGESIQKNGESIQKNGEFIRQNGESIRQNASSVANAITDIRQNGESIRKIGDDFKSVNAKFTSAFEQLQKDSNNNSGSIVNMKNDLTEAFSAVNLELQSMSNQTDYLTVNILEYISKLSFTIERILSEVESSDESLKDNYWVPFVVSISFNVFLLVLVVIGVFLYKNKKRNKSCRSKGHEYQRLPSNSSDESDPGNDLDNDLEDAEGYLNPVDTFFRFGRNLRNNFSSLYSSIRSNIPYYYGSSWGSYDGSVRETTYSHAAGHAAEDIEGQSQSQGQSRCEDQFQGQQNPATFEQSNEEQHKDTESNISTSSYESLPYSTVEQTDYPNVCKIEVKPHVEGQVEIQGEGHSQLQGHNQCEGQRSLMGLENQAFSPSDEIIEEPGKQDGQDGSTHINQNSCIIDIPNQTESAEEKSEPSGQMIQMGSGLLLLPDILPAGSADVNDKAVQKGLLDKENETSAASEEEIYAGRVDIKDYDLG